MKALMTVFPSPQCNKITCGWSDHIHAITFCLWADNVHVICKVQAISLVDVLSNKEFSQLIGGIYRLELKTPVPIKGSTKKGSGGKEKTSFFIRMDSVWYGGLKEVKVFNRFFFFGVQLQTKSLLCLCLEMGIKDLLCKRVGSCRFQSDISTWRLTFSLFTYQFRSFQKIENAAYRRDWKSNQTDYSVQFFSI